MSTLFSPNKDFIHLQSQPNFPNEDLTKGNAELLKYILGHSVGLDAYTAELTSKQRYIHLLANKAMVLLGSKTHYDPTELFAFSHGFASFETISDMVRPTPTSNIAAASARVSEFFIDTRSELAIRRDQPTEAKDEFDIAFEKELLGIDEEPQGLGIDEENEVLYFDSVHNPEDDASDEDKLPFPLRIPLTQAMEDALRGIQTHTLVVTGRDRAHPEEIFTTRHTILPNQYPNVYDTVIAVGDKRHETMVQLQLRIAGASLARTLQTRD